MSFYMGLAQACFPHDRDLIEHIESYVALAHNKDVALLAFPENLMCPKELNGDEVRRIAEPLDGAFVRSVSGMARNHGIWIVFTLYEVNPAGGPPFNTAVVVDSQGCLQGVYRKCHLYDAHGVRESDRMAFGDELCHAVSTPFCTIGLGICYDLRFPEVSRALALQGCDVLVFPAAWHDGPHKATHWKTLLRARAIENECFVAGVCRADGRYVGISHVFDPLGNEALDNAVQEDKRLVVCNIDLDLVRTTRDAMPILAHRKPELYGLLAKE